MTAILVDLTDQGGPELAGTRIRRGEAMRGELLAGRPQQIGATTSAFRLTGTPCNAELRSSAGSDSGS